MSLPFIDLEQMIERGLVRLGRGNVISKKDIAACPGDYPIYSSARLNNGKFGEYGKYMFDEELITWSVDGGGNFFYRPKHRFSVTNVGGTLKILDKAAIDCKYLFYILTAKHERLQFDWTQKAHPSVIRRLYNEIPLPPLSEQKRIAAILDAADVLQAKRRESLEQLDQLLQSTFLEMFGDPVTNPKGWEVATLGDVANFHAGSTLPSGNDFADQVDGFLYLKVGDLNHPDNSTEIVRANLWGESSQRGITAPKNAVVIPKRGGAIGTNKKRLLTRPAVLDPNLMAISAGKRIIHHYILRWFHTFDLKSITSGSSVPQLNKRDLAPLSIPLPPLDLQQHFASIVESIEQQKARYRAHLAELDTLFASLQSRAFSGEL